MTDLELVRAVLAFYDGKAERWKNGGGENGDEDDGPCCVALATDRLFRESQYYLHNQLALALGFVNGDLNDPEQPNANTKAQRDMYAWNDAPGRTFADVQERLRAAEARLSGGG